MKGWIAAATGRLISGLVIVWLLAAVVWVVRPLDVLMKTTAAAVWPLWASIPTVVICAAVQFASGAIVLASPIIGYALVVYGRPWRDPRTTPARRSSTQQLQRDRAAAHHVAPAPAEDTIVSVTRIISRPITKKGVRA